MQFQEPNEQLSKLSIDLHHRLCEAGFTEERIRLQSRLVDHIESLYQELYDDDQYHWSIAGSFGDVWGNNLFTLDGRTDEHESDVDWTCIMRHSKFHFRETCQCDQVNKRYMLTLDHVNEGHIKFNFEQLREPAEPHDGIGLRPKVDECTAYVCCSCPHEIFCKEVKDVFNTEDVAKALTLIQASRPGHENTELRFGFAMFEKRRIRQLNTIQGQLFLLIKYFLTNKLNKDVFAFKSYHAKTLLFFMLREFPSTESVWKEEKYLVSLLLYSFDFLIKQMRERKASSKDQSGFHAGMSSFFLEGCFIYFHKKVFADYPHDSLIRVIEGAKKDIKNQISEYMKLLRPLKDDQQGLIFHPYILFPTRLTLQFCKRTSADNLYLRLYYCLEELLVMNEDRKVEFLRHVESLPPNAFTACLCLKVMTHLKFNDKDEAVKLLRKHQFHTAQYSVPIKDLTVTGASDASIAAALKTRIESTDTAWCFAFTYDQIRSLNFEFLNEELYNHCITRSSTYPVDVVVDFNCLTRLFHLLLCEDRTILEKWRNDLPLKKPPLSEVYLYHCLQSSNLPVSEQLPQVSHLLNESIKNSAYVYDRKFLPRLVESFDSERRKIFGDWLKANIDSVQFITLYCASIVSDKELLSKAVARALVIAEKILHYQDFKLLLQMRRCLCKLDYKHLDSWWARLSQLNKSNLLNVEEVLVFLEAADEASRSVADAENFYKHLNAAISLLQGSRKVLQFLKLKDFRLLVQARGKCVELDPAYLKTWLEDFRTRIQSPENAGRAPFFIVELMSLVNCLKTNRDLSSYVKLCSDVVETILQLGLSKADATRVNRVKFVLSRLT